MYITTFYVCAMNVMTVGCVCVRVYYCCYYRTEHGPASDDSQQFSLPDSLLIRLFEVALTLSTEPDKIKYNSMRMIGNLLRYAPANALGLSVCLPVCLSVWDKILEIFSIVNNEPERKGRHCTCTCRISLTDSRT